MTNPFSKNAAKMPLIQRNDEIQALSSQGSDQPFTECVCFRRLRRGSQYSQPESLRHCIVKAVRKDRVAIMDQKAMRDRACWDARREEQEKLRLWITAIHEAGHCLGARLGGRKIKEATIVPSKKFEGCVSHEIDIHQPYPTEYQMEEWLLGHAAEVEFGFTGGIGHEYDYEHAAELLKAPIKRAKSLAWSERTDIWGSNLNHTTNDYEEHAPYSTSDIRPRMRYVDGKPVDVAKDWQKSVRATKAEWRPEFDKYVRKARRLAKKYRAWIERVAKLLLEERTLTDKEIPPL